MSNMGGLDIIFLLVIFVASGVYFWLLCDEENDEKKDLEDDLEGWWEYFIYDEDLDDDSGDSFDNEAPKQSSRKNNH